MGTRKIGAEIGLTGEKEFNAQMTACNSNLKTMRSDMAACSAEFNGHEGRLTAVAQKHKILAQTEDQQKEKIRGLEQQLKAASEAFGENSAQVDKYHQQLNFAKADLAKTKEALKENSLALKALKAAGEGAKDAVVGVGKGALAMSKTMVAAGAAATAAMATLAVAGVKALTDAAVEAAENGDPAFAGLADSLALLDGASASAKAALGSVLLPALEQLSGEGAALLTDFSSAMAAAGGDTEKMGQVTAEYVGKAAQLIKDQLPQFMSLAGGLISGLSEGLLANAPELLDDAQEIIETLLDGIIDAAPALGDAAIELITMLVQTLIQSAPELLSSGMELVNDLISGLAAAAPGLVPAAVDLVTQLLLSLVTNAPLLVEAGLELILGVIQGLVEAGPQLLAQVPVIISNLIQAFTDAWPKIKSIGQNIVKGIGQGIEDGKQWLMDLISGWVSNIVTWIKDKLGIKSPSSVMADQVGVMMAKGVGVGWDREMQKVNAEIADSINTSFSPKKPSSPGSSSFGSSSGPSGASPGRIVNIRIEAKGLTKADIDYLVAQVNNELGEMI